MTMNFSEYFKYLLDKSGKSKSEIARISKLSRSYFSEIQGGRNVPPLDRCHQILKIFGYTEKDPEWWRLIELAVNERATDELKPFIKVRKVSMDDEGVVTAEEYPADAIKIKDFINIPILGDVPAGPKTYIDDDVMGWFPVPKSSKMKKCYLLRVVGDSMSGIDLKNGDYALMCHCNNAKNGDIVAIRVNDETTIKRYFYHPDKKILVLKAENPKYTDQVFTDGDVEIKGIYKGKFAPDLVSMYLKENVED